MSECPPGVHSMFDFCPGNCTDDQEEEVNCGNHEVHPGHTYRDSEGNLQVCIGVPPERWNG